MQKKAVVLIVRQHSGEIDWILPLLSKLNKRFRIITIFSNKEAYLSLKKNSDLFNLWKKECNDFVILKKYQKILWKILHRITLSIFKKNAFFFKKIEKKILLKFFSINDFLNKFSINIEDIKVIFLTHIHASFLPNIFKNKNNKISIIRFPESTMYFASKKENKFYKDYKSFSRIYGDYFLFSSKPNAQMFLNSSLKKIKYCSQPRYEKWWNQKFVNFKKKNKNYFKILVLLRGPNQLYFSEESYKKVLNDLLKLLKINNNFQLVFKEHPNNIGNEDHVLKDFLSKNNQIKTSNKHVINLAKECDICISILTSACFDAIINKLPVIEYFDVNKEIKSSPKSRGFLHLAYDDNLNKWQTIFEKKKIVKNIKSFPNLKNFINDIYNQKPYIKIIFNKNYKNFKKMLSKDLKTKDLCNFIESI